MILIGVRNSGDFMMDSLSGENITPPIAPADPPTILPAVTDF